MSFTKSKLSFCSIVDAVYSNYEIPLKPSTSTVLAWWEVLKRRLCVCYFTWLQHFPSYLPHPIHHCCLSFVLFFVSWPLADFCFSSHLTSSGTDLRWIVSIVANCYTNCVPVRRSTLNARLLWLVSSVRLDLGYLVVTITALADPTESPLRKRRYWCAGTTAG